MKSLLPLLLLCVALARPAQADEVMEGGFVPIQTPQLEGLIIRHTQGQLIVRGWDRPEIHISFLKRARSAAMLDRLRVQVDLRDRTVTIRSGITTRGELRALPQPDTSIDLTIDVPRSAQLTASTFSGDLTASGFRAGVDLGSTSGVIRVSDVSGVVHTHAARGGQVLRSIQGEVLASGLDSDVDVASVEGPSLSAQVVQGQVTARDVRSQVVTLQTAVGTLLLLGALSEGARYTLHVDEGDIRVSVPMRAFSLSAQGQRIDNRFRLDAGAKLVGGRLLGTCRGGGPRLELTAPQGQVTLLPQ